MKKIIEKLSFFHYNVGFFPLGCKITIEKPNIIWMKHNYRDRFFADPFILDITNDYILVLVEEFLYSKWKGRISLLYVDKNTYKLERIKVLLDLNTHLSFPFVYRENKDIYIIPENSKSGSLVLYKYENETLKLLGVLVDEPIIDPVLVKENNAFLLFGSLLNKNENADLYVWKSNDLMGEYVKTTLPIIKNSPHSSRRAGNFFFFNGNRYSAVQRCVNSYGEALNICEVLECSDSVIKENILFTIYPDNNYPNGIHTFNTYKNMCVVDGLKYLFNPLGKIKKYLF